MQFFFVSFLIKKQNWGAWVRWEDRATAASRGAGLTHGAGRGFSVDFVWMLLSHDQP